MYPGRTGGQRYAVAENREELTGLAGRHLRVSACLDDQAGDHIAVGADGEDAGCEKEEQGASTA